MTKHHLFIAALTVSVLASCRKDLTPNERISPDVVAGNAGGNAAPELSDGNFVANEVLVKFKKGTSESARLKALSRMNGNVQEHIRTKAMERIGDEGVFLIHSS